MEYVTVVLLGIQFFFIRPIDNLTPFFLLIQKFTFSCH